MRIMRLLSFMILMSLIFMASQWTVDAQDGQQTEPLHILGKYGGMNDFAWSPDSSTLAVSTFTGMVLYDQSLNEVGFLEPTGDIRLTAGLLWKPDGTQLFSSNEPVRLPSGIFAGSHAYVWDIGTGEIVRTLTLDEGVNAYSQGWNHVENTVLMMLSTQTEVFGLLLWNIETGDTQEIDILDLGLAPDVQWNWKEDDQSVVTIVKDEQITVAIANPAEIDKQTIISPNSALDSPNGQHTVSHEKGVFVVRTANGNTIELKSDETGRFQGFTDIVWSDASNRVAVWGRHGVPNLMVADMFIGSVALQFTYDYEGTVMDAKFAPNGSALAILTYGNELFVYDFGTHARYHRKFNSVATSLAFSPDGSKLASVTGSNQQVYIWDTTTGDLLDTWETPNDPKGATNFIFTVAWSPDGQYVATGSVAGGTANNGRESRPIDLFIWSAETGKVIQIVPAVAYDFDFIAELEWSADSQALAYSTISNQTARSHIGVYNLATQELNFQTPLEISVWDIALHPDGAVLALTALNIDRPDEQQIIFVDARTGDLLDVRTPPIDMSLRSIDWHPSGDYLASLVDRNDGLQVQIWSWQTDTPLGFYMYFDLEGEGGRTSLEWNAQGNQLATWYFGEENEFGAQVWDISFEDSTANLNMIFLPDYPSYFLPVVSFDALDWSNDGSMIATSLSRVTSSIWEIPAE